MLDSDGLSERNRATILRLLIAELDKLGDGLEQLQFAETRAAETEHRMSHLRNSRNSFG